ncbi:MAG: D-alanyl-D-alanine carboxypeptidase family protein, partial [Alphaproteobacteria bacterium]
MKRIRGAVLFVWLFGLAAGAAQAIETPAKYAVLMDAETGLTMFEKNADELMAPASMSKLMTVEMLFHRLKNGDVSLTDKFLVSENAWRKGGAASGSSTMFAKVNSEIPVEALLRGVIVQSG